MNGRKLGTLGRNVLRSGTVVAVMAVMAVGCDFNGFEIFPNDPTKPDEFDCFCGCGEDPFGQELEIQGIVCGLEIIEAQAACTDLCNANSCFFGSQATGPNTLGTDSAACAPKEFPPPPGFRITGDVLNSSDGVMSYANSIGTITYTGEAPVNVHVAGEFAFTGGCESDTGPSVVASTCPIVFNRIYLLPDNFSVPTPVGTFYVTDASITNYGDQAGTQSGRSFTIPSANVQMTVRGYVNGIQHALQFAPTPDEDLNGIHVPSTAQFGFFGNFTQLDGDLTLTLNLNGTMTARPPAANAGASQTVSCNPLTGTGAALLDGSASSDIDGDLVTVAWFDGDTALGTGLTLNAAFDVGTHMVTAIAWDDTSKFNLADTTVTVVHDEPPAFDAPSSITVPACTPGLVILSTPEVIDLCSATSPAVTGEIVEINGVVLVTPIPVDTVTGVIALPSGTAIVVWTASTNGGTATLEQTIEISNSPDLSCCAPSHLLYQGTPGADSKIDPNASTGYCMFGYGANDQLKSGSFADFISGGPGNDKLTSQGGDDVIFGDAGNDDITYQGNGTIVISGGNGNDKIHVAFGPTSRIFAGGGDDQVTCDGGNDTIYPGPGRDTIRAGSGDDTVIFYSLCEFDSRKVLNGGAGNDTLIIPVPLSSLPDVQVIGFEHIVVDGSQQHLAECP